MNSKALLCQIGCIAVAAAVLFGCGRDAVDTSKTPRSVDVTATAASMLLSRVLAQATSAQTETQAAFDLSAQSTPIASPSGADVPPSVSQADQVATLVAATLAAIPTATMMPPSTVTPSSTPDWGATQTAETAQVATSVAATLSALPTATPGWTATSEALAAQVSTSVAATMAAQRAPTPQPRAGNFRACLEPCAANGVNARWSVPEAVTKVYVAYDYGGIPANAHYQRIWRVVGRGEWVRYDCTWPGPSDGTVEVTLTEPNGLHSGEWEMSIVVDGAVILQESFVVEGSWRAWYPAGVIPNCFGKVSTR